MIDSKYILEHITEEQILTIMKELGATPYTNKNKTNEIWFKTICHGGDSHKLCYYRDSKTFYCYSNCGSLSIFNLVMQVTHCSFGESIKLISSKLGITNRNGFSINTLSFNKEFNEINTYLELRCRKKNTNTGIKHLPLLVTNILRYFDKNTFYQGWIDEGISIETMEKFNIMWYELEKHIIIPHYNANNELVGIRRRSLQEKDKSNKYMPEILEGITYSHQLGLNLYGLNINIDNIKRTKKIVIAESEKSVMLSHDFYGDNSFVVATCGFNITNWQRDMILSLGVEEVILGFDKDFELKTYDEYEDKIELEKYKRYVNRIYSLAYKFVPYCRTYVLWDSNNLLGIKDSPFDKGKETLEKLMKLKIEITTDREGDA